MANKPALAALGRCLRGLYQIGVWSTWMIPPSTPGLVRLGIPYIAWFLPGEVSAHTEDAHCLLGNMSLLHCPAQLHPALLTRLPGAA